MSDNNGEQRPQRKFVGVWIPAFVWDHPKLTWFQKCLLAEIHVLGGLHGECWASNAHLAEVMGTTPANINVRISELRALNLVSTAGMDGRKRWLKTHLEITDQVQAGRTPAFRQVERGGSGSLNAGVQAEPTPIIRESITEGTAKGTEEKRGEDDPFPSPSPAEPSPGVTDCNQALPSVTSVVEAWNTAAETSGLPKVQAVTESRKRAIKARLRDPFWCDNWRVALGKVVLSDFCRGTNDRGWTADIDWFLRPDSVAKTIEGKYDNRKAVAQPPVKRELRPGIDYAP